MHIFLAGGTGVVGTPMIPALLAAGHSVTATTRREDRVAELNERGATGVVMDVYDEEQTAAVVAASGADMVLHELTDLSGTGTEANARLRRDGTANLIAAAKAAGVDRIVGQSITWIFPDADHPADEATPIIPGTPVDVMEQGMQSLPHATILRYGALYGPNTWYARGGRIAEAVQAGKLPATPAISTFVHIDDVVAATVQALDWPDGIYHIVDDEPAAATTWLPAYAAVLGAAEPPQQSLPAGAPTGRAVTNKKAREAGWDPQFPSWRQGFMTL